MARGLIIIGALPPPTHGQSVAFEMLVDHLRAKRSDVAVLDISSGAASASHVGTLRSLVHYLRCHLSFVRLMLRRPGAVVYQTIAQSRMGFLRDLGFFATGRLLGARFVWHLHGGNYGGFYEQQSPSFRRIIRFVLRRIDRVIVLGETLRSMFDFVPELETRIRVVPNAIPPFVQVSPGPKRFSASEGRPFHLLFLSNLIESKGFFTLLEAVKILKDDCPFAVHADFCGHFFTNQSDDIEVTSAEQAAELFRTRVETWGIGTLVTYHGAVSGREKEARFAEADAFVLPTRYDNEGQPISIIEAMAHGIPVLSTDYRAIPDLLTDGETGYFVDANDARSIANRVVALGSDPALYESMSRLSIERARTRFSAAVHLDRLDAILEECGRSERPGR